MEIIMAKLNHTSFAMTKRKLVHIGRIEKAKRAVK